MAAEPSFDDKRDFVDADRGFIAALEPGVIKNGKGDVVWNINDFKFLQGECPDTAHPFLWRQGQLNSKQGLYEIVPGIYQIRAFDLSNMTIVEGKEGIIIIDPLISCECAKAGLEIYQQHRGSHRPITGVIYSHSHGDRVIPQNPDPSLPIIAPEGFMEAILSESMIAGPAMRQRGAYMYGRALTRGPKGHFGTGLGMASSAGTEAPAEINFHFPDFRALCIPETATNCMHNIVRDSKAWSQYLDEAIVMFGYDSDVVFGSHNWPTFGQAELITRFSEQRDMYGYLHDQTVHMMNSGMTGVEIAERLQLPPNISKAWHCRGFYGSTSHNVKGKGIYQKYMTWFDGNPSHLWQYPPREEGERYIACMGGVDALCARAEEYINKGDSRFAATLLGHAKATQPSHEKSNILLATAYENLGYGAENATWRNFYLVAAKELRTGEGPGLLGGGRTPLGPSLTVEQWFDILSVQVDGERAATEERRFAIDFELLDIEETWRLLLSNGVLIYRGRLRRQRQDGTIRVT
ncbi:hydrolase [Colletotrichum plurivorum]|uniref:Hydrolase n=1 Tax=Colletotrichum plurivorum TaxID=2175906 RepID=A0A8H6MWZ2_9PEZI|nr:hydrolase [Colletotrichum plurivorum]